MIPDFRLTWSLMFHDHPCRAPIARRLPEVLTGLLEKDNALGVACGSVDTGTSAMCAFELHPVERSGSHVRKSAVLAEFPI